MTSTPRTYADPREVVARAIAEAIEVSFQARLRQSWDDLSPLARATMRSRADAALTALRTHGFLSDLCFTAMKAHK